MMDNKENPQFQRAKNSPVMQSILKRRDLRCFDENSPISKEIIDDLLYVAIWAPNHKLTEPWKFFVVHDSSQPQFLKAYCEGLKELNLEENVLNKKRIKAQDSFKRVPLFLGVAYKSDSTPLGNQENMITVACGIQNMLLLAQEKGIYVHWSSGKTWETRQMKEFLELKKDENLIAMLQLGYVKNCDFSKMKRSPIEKFTSWV